MSGFTRAAQPTRSAPSPRFVLSGFHEVPLGADAGHAHVETIHAIYMVWFPRMW